MNLRHIEIIHAIVLHGSITAAAKALHVSQPNVTRILSHAEQQIGFELFERTAQGLTPRPETLRLMPEIEQLMQQRAAIDSMITQLKHGYTQTLRLGAAQALAQTVLPTILLELRESMPNINIELSTGHWDTLCDSLLRQQIDIAVVFNQHSQPGIHSETISRLPLMALLPPEHPPCNSITVEELGDTPLLMQPLDPLGRILHAALEAHQIQPESPWLIKSYTVIAEMAEKGAGIGVVDAFTAHHYRDRVQVVPLTPVIWGEVALISLERQQLPLPAHALAKCLKQHLNAPCFHFQAP